MANFTGQPISSSYQRVLQIDSNIIQDGLGNTVNATINSLTGSFSGILFFNSSLILTLNAKNNTDLSSGIKSNAFNQCNCFLFTILWFFIKKRTTPFRWIIIQ